MFHPCFFLSSDVLLPDGALTGGSVCAPNVVNKIEKSSGVHLVPNSFVRWFIRTGSTRSDEGKRRSFGILNTLHVYYLRCEQIFSDVPRRSD